MTVWRVLTKGHLNNTGLFRASDTGLYFAGVHHSWIKFYA